MSTIALAALVVEGLKVASGLIAFARKASENDDVLEAIVATARADGREVGVAEVKTAIADMRAAGDSLAAKLGQPPG